MEYILVLLIVALLNGAIAYIDGLMEGIIPLTLYAEQYRQNPKHGKASSGKTVK